MGSLFSSCQNREEDWHVEPINCMEENRYLCKSIEDVESCNVPEIDILHGTDLNGWVEREKIHIQRLQSSCVIKEITECFKKENKLTILCAHYKNCRKDDVLFKKLNELRKYYLSTVNNGKVLETFVSVREEGAKFRLKNSTEKEKKVYKKRVVKQKEDDQEQEKLFELNKIGNVNNDDLDFLENTHQKKNNNNNNNGSTGVLVDLF